MTLLWPALCVWSTVAIGWWAAAFVIVGRKPVHPPPDAGTRAVISIFKPLPRLPDGASLRHTAEAIESFVAQLDSASELIIGVPLDQSERWLPEIERWRRVLPAAVIKVVCLPSPDHLPNPKIAWQQRLSHEATGELWLWSDADICAPAGLVATLRKELTFPETNAVTCAYTVSGVEHATGIWDALFVNAEFLPGAMWLGRKGTVDFTFGACVLFRAKDFASRLDWDELGRWLADDFRLGQKLGCVRVSAMLVQTQTHRGTLPGAIAHYQRWHKTIRWCRAGGYAGMLAILPLLGWLGAMIAQPHDTRFQAGFMSQWIVETLVGVLMLARVGCRYTSSALVWIAGWPLLRAGIWLWSWLPTSVVWGNPARRWHGPKTVE